jgi:hypothetical protein
MYLLYSLFAVVTCALIYRWTRIRIDRMVHRIETPWLRVSLGVTLKLLALCLTTIIGVCTVLFIVLQAAAKDNRKS